MRNNGIILGGIIFYVLAMFCFFIAFTKTVKIEEKYIKNRGVNETNNKITDYTKQAKVDMFISAIMFSINYISVHKILLNITMLIALYMAYQAAIRVELISIYLKENSNTVDAKFAKKIVNKIIMICILIGTVNIIKFAYAWI